MYPVLFTIFNYEVSTYSVCILIGIFVCFYVFKRQCKRDGLSKDVFETYILLGTIAIIIGFITAMLYQAVYNWIDRGVFNLFSGVTFIGGLIGGVATFLIGGFFVIKGEAKENFGAVCRYAIPSILIAHAFGRLGCFFAGCCYGIATDSFLGVVFPTGAYLGAVHPTQLYEAAFLFISFFIIYKFNKYAISEYLISYGIWRFLIEFIRGDERGQLVPGLSPSQFWSILMVIAGIIVLLIMLKKNRSVKIKSSQ